MSSAALPSNPPLSHRGDFPVRHIAEFACRAVASGAPSEAGPGKERLSSPSVPNSTTHDARTLEVHWITSQRDRPLSAGSRSRSRLIVVMGFLTDAGQPLVDTETIEGALFSGGVWTTGRFEGEFALIGVDFERQEIIAITDPLAMHSIFVYRSSGGFILGSSLALVLKLGEHDLSLDPRGLQEYLALGFAGLHADTVFSSVTVLPPQTFTRYDWLGTLLESRSYKQQSPQTNVGSVTSALPMLMPAICNQRAKMADAMFPGRAGWCLPLTAGKDSVLVAAALRGAGRQLAAWTYGNPESDDIREGRRRAAALGLPHRVVDIEASLHGSDIAAVFRLFALQSGGQASMGMLDLALFYEALNGSSGDATPIVWSGLGGELLRNYLNEGDSFFSTYVTDPLVLSTVAGRYPSLSPADLWRDLTTLFPPSENFRPEEHFYLQRRMPRKVGIRNAFVRRNVLQINPMLGGDLLLAACNLSTEDRGDDLMRGLLRTMWPAGENLWNPPRGRVANQDMIGRLFGLYRNALLEVFAEIHSTPLDGVVSPAAIQEILRGSRRLPRVEWFLIRLAGLVAFLTVFRRMSLLDLKKALQAPLLPSGCVVL